MTFCDEPHSTQGDSVLNVTQST